MVSVTRTQRWRRGSQRWRRAGEDVFDPERYEVTAVDDATAAAFCREHHYSASWPSTVHRYAMWDHHTEHRALVGIIAFGVPMSQRVLTNQFPTLVPSLNRVDTLIH